MAKTTTKPDNPVRLRAYLGLDHRGNPAMFVSTVPLNPVGGRLIKGEAIRVPEALFTWMEEGTWDAALTALEAMQAYFDQLAEKGRR